MYFDCLDSDSGLGPELFEILSQKEGMVTHLRKTCRAGSPCSILLIEDEDSIAELLEYAATLYEPGCFNFTHATTLEDAASKFNAIIYDLVVVDLGLQHSSGFATFATTQKFVDGRAPIAVLTAEDDEDMELRCIVDGGAVAYVVKPINNASHFLRRCRGWILKYRRDMEICATLKRDNELLQNVQDRILAVAPEDTSVTQVARELFDLAEIIGARYTGIKGIAAH